VAAASCEELYTDSNCCSLHLTVQVEVVAQPTMVEGVVQVA
jgi:hypothetical protein